MRVGAHDPVPPRAAKVGQVSGPTRQVEDDRSRREAQRSEVRARHRRSRPKVITRLTRS